MSTYEIRFYKWEEQLRDQVYLRQPFGDRWEEYTWGETCQMARKLATGLKSLGLPEKSHIGLVSKNCREWIIADMAIMMAGYVSVPFYPTLTSKQIHEVIRLGDVAALFIGKMEVWEEMKKGVPEGMPIIAFPHYEGNSKVDEGEQWHEFINRFEPMQGQHYPDTDDIWTIVFTSGTTGTPKGVVLPYSILDSTSAVAEKTNALKVSFEGDNRFFSYLPLNHIAERVVVENTSFGYGGTISFVENLDTFAQNLRDARPTVFFAVPRIWTKFQMGVLAKMPQEKLDRLLKIPLLSSLVKRKIKASLGLDKARVTMSGAAPISQSLKAWYKKLGIFIAEGYGMTENCAICTNLDGKDSRPGSVGKAQALAEIKIDEDSGEILMKAPYVMKGYYKDPDKTAETLKDGWLHTGDQGHIDKDGYLFITGRVKDTFKTTKGKFIVPAPIEWKFEHNPDIEQICVMGLGCPQPIALAVASDIGKSKSPEAIRASLSDTLEEVNKELPNYQKVSSLVVVKDAWGVENGLLTPTLKVKRGAMNQKYQEHLLNWHENTDSIIFQ
ncbi:MAG: AMP-binding protein [Bacteroidota bacterium]